MLELTTFVGAYIAPEGEHALAAPDMELSYGGGDAPQFQYTIRVSGQRKMHVMFRGLGTDIEWWWQRGVGQHRGQPCPAEDLCQRGVVVHRVGAPAMSSGHWFLHGRAHRVDGPAIGDSWFLWNSLHRIEGKAGFYSWIGSVRYDEERPWPRRARRLRWLLHSSTE